MKIEQRTRLLDCTIARLYAQDRELRVHQWVDSGSDAGSGLSNKKFPEWPCRCIVRTPLDASVNQARFRAWLGARGHMAENDATAREPADASRTVPMGHRRRARIPSRRFGSNAKNSIAAAPVSAQRGGALLLLRAP
jgi:hypothetical protein